MLSTMVMISQHNFLAGKPDGQFSVPEVPLTIGMG